MNVAEELFVNRSPAAVAALVRRRSTIDDDEVRRVTGNIDAKISIEPKLGIICGSGLGKIADQLDQETKEVIPYKDIDGFPECTVQGHAGNLVFGMLSGVPTVCMQGRLHLYEGHPPWIVTMPIRVMKLLGVKVIIVTNAAGGINPEFNRGDIMIIKDHINLAGMAGHNPLVGPNAVGFGPRFPEMSVAYDKELRDITRETALELKYDEFLKEGVYVHLIGPNYETPSECRFLRMCGADAVGMSTAPEVVVARHAGIRILGMSLITNECIVDIDSVRDDPPNHQEVMATADRRATDIQRLVTVLVEKLNKRNFFKD